MRKPKEIVLLERFVEAYAAAIDQGERCDLDFYWAGIIGGVYHDTEAFLRSTKSKLKVDLRPKKK